MEKRLHSRIFYILTTINVFIQKQKKNVRKENQITTELKTHRPFFSWEQTCNTEKQISPKGCLMMKTLGENLLHCIIFLINSV